QDKVDALQEDYDGMSESAETDVLKAQVSVNLNIAKMELEDIKDNYWYYQNLPDDIDLDRLTAELDIANARVEDAQRDYDRLKDGASKESLAALQAAADQAQAAANNAQWAFDQLVLKAPYEAVFVKCDLTVGEFVTLGQNVALVADMSKWMVESEDLDEIEVNLIDTTQPVSITVDAISGMEFTGSLESISQYFSDDNGDILYTAMVNLQDFDDLLRWGMTMQLEFVKK
ncbi:MAG: efflux RND transporter periplasmic adaptor subunit, partial [Anaerolineaceae bacterium]